MVNTTRCQTLAEHQYGVAILAGEIAARMGRNDEDVVTITAAALLHDADEVRTGDIPTPTKTRLKGASVPDLFDKAFADIAIPVMSGTVPDMEQILKCADYLESLLFLSEHRVGRHADAVLEDVTNHAFEYFRTSGEAGRHATKILSEIQGAMYEI